MTLSTHQIERLRNLEARVRHDTASFDVSDFLLLLDILTTGDAESQPSAGDKPCCNKWKARMRQTGEGETAYYIAGMYLLGEFNFCPWCGSKKHSDKSAGEAKESELVRALNALIWKLPVRSEQYQGLDGLALFIVAELEDKGIVVAWDRKEERFK